MSEKKQASLEPSPEIGARQKTSVRQAKQREKQLTQLLLQALREHSPRSEDELLALLDVNTQDLWRVARLIAERPYASEDLQFDEQNKLIFLVRRGQEIANAIPITQIRGQYRIALLSDTRFGSLQQQVTALHTAYSLLEELRVDFAVLTGNLVAGKETKARAGEVFLHDPEEQVSYAVKYFPKTKVFKTYVLSGPRDMSFPQRDLAREVCEQRPDLVHSGDREANFPIRKTNCVITAMHPADDPGPRGKSYPLQKIVDEARESFEQKEKEFSPDIDIQRIVAAGGWHTAMSIPSRMGMRDSISLPSFISVTPLLKRRGVEPQVGLVILELTFDEPKDPTVPRSLVSERSRFIPLDRYTQHDDHLVGAEYLSACENDDERQVLEWLMANPRLSESEISARLGKPKREALVIIERLKERKYPIMTPKETKRYVLNRPLREQFVPHQVKPETFFASSFRAGFTSDEHLGSHEQQIMLLEQIGKRFEQEGIEFWASVGDGLEGTSVAGYRGHQNDVEYTRAPELIEYGAMRFPRIVRKEGRKRHPVPIKLIAGNHPLWIYAQSGIDIVSNMADKRPDIEYLGRVEGSFDHDGTRFKLSHPAGGLGYTLSLTLQKHVQYMKEQEDAHPSTATEFLLCGDKHVAVFLCSRGKFSYMVPCLKAADDFHKARGLSSSIGYWIVEVTKDTEGNITSVCNEYVDLRPFVSDTDWLDAHLWLLERYADEAILQRMVSFLRQKHSQLLQNDTSAKNSK